MVYYGPSKGCRRCRERRVRCDQGHPACLKCTKRDIPCPGYKDIFDNAHRDETLKFRKYHSRTSKADPTVAKSPTRDITALSKHPELFQSILPNVEDDALSFFFLRYSQSHDHNTTYNVFGILPDMYAKSTMSSPLNYATRALALQVTHLHRTHGAKIFVGGELYAKAVSYIKEAVTVPDKCRSNELLLATLVLEAYDNVNTTFGKREDGAPQSSSHLRGSIALLQYRGTLNYGDELSWRLVTATRNRLIQDSWHSADGLAGFEAIQKIWDNEAAGKPRGPAVEADTLAFRLAWLRHLYRAVSNGSLSRDEEKISDTEQLKQIVFKASHLANDCALFKSTLPVSWQPASVPASSLAISIQAASVYEHVTPTIYAQLSIAHSTNRQRLTELGCISLIGSCVANIIMRGDLQQRQRGPLPPPLLARAQDLMDEICASVPFFTGNVTADTSNTSTVLVPSVAQISAERKNGNCTLPENIAKHTEQVMASGLYMMYFTLTASLDLVGGNKVIDLLGNSLRDGQDEWIVGQINRLRDILPLVDVPI
ncbi:hypothetical protein K469DRAFT_742107 [Zopfia rhizophila CBS 207.26]|uniref:Zn(2)-C6 fungal-type domain-containing protein n=1 Tax=Zopfia rhizophila CBS 207.26 TaxID=1314779 RepID=A0A6A6DFM6_9PEZI|nr:hypothetical protein K469DRAFT_742107 [Zopfia rhizophila CBS 207.26]